MTCLRCVTPSACSGNGCSPGTWPTEAHECRPNSLGECGACGRQNVAMPKTVKERQEDLRARRLMEGMTEVRGIYLPPGLHAELKEYAKRMAKKASDER